MTRICERCHKEFPSTSKLLLHINRKTPCAIISNSISLRTCHRCHQTFSTTQKLRSHLERKFQCKMRDDPLEKIQNASLPNGNLQRLFERLEQQQRELEGQKKKIATLESMTQSSHDISDLNLSKSNINKKTKNNATANITTNTHLADADEDEKQAMFELYAFGKENLSHITDTMYKNCFKKKHKSVEKFFEIKHFSKQMPQNHNLYVSNLKNQYIMLFDGTEWKLANKAPTMEKMYYDIKDALSNALDRMRNDNCIDTNLADLFSPFVDDPIDDKYEEQIKKTSCDEMVCMAYNHRKTPMNVRAQMEKTENK